MSNVDHDAAGLIEYLAEAFEENEDRLTERILEAAKRHGYARDASTLEAAWRLSVRMLTAAVIGGLRDQDRRPEADVSGGGDRSADFARAVVASHRARGVSLPMFMGLFKLYGRAYAELLLQAEIDREARVEALMRLRDVFDGIEVNLCEEWNAVDRTERFRELQAANRFLANEKNKYLTLFESLGLPAFILRPDGRLDNVNKAAMELMGWQAAQSGGAYYRSMRERKFAPGQDRAEKEAGGLAAGLAENGLAWLQEEADRFLLDGAPLKLLEKSLDVEEGKRVFAITLCRMADLSDKFAGVTLILNEVTEARRREEELTRALRDRGVLFKEVHHRVKNNMQIISSLISLQAQKTTSREAAAAFLKSQLRIRAMATAHEKLYRSEAVDSIGLGSYLRDVLGIVQQAFRSEGAAIDVVAEVEEAVVSMDAAVPCGLIVSELVSNCFKHAFKRKERGVVRLLVQSQGTLLVLAVEDDGDGLAPEAAESLGMELVRALVEQLYGSLMVRSEAGTRFEIVFPAG